ncbi:hypothetical protein L914_02948 [Phytophthora nicotianae]|uniref:Uncharacterized protein n=2 Tax=Phytophthora nicotianae TaxID=4792 RepID=V9FRF4_PHYNI|nr:hypothetical protein F443_03101 [Phytophthora nicotianae P1569]ETM53587.1 hypothetical protein L914_02948 [Phytophthora nicotianae]
MDIDGIPIPKDYKSPLQERGESKKDTPKQPIPTRKAFIDFVHKSPPSADDTYIYGRYIWKSDHVLADGRRLVRVHMTDLFAPESADKLKEMYEDKYATQQYSVDKDLMTGAIWVFNDNKPDFPLRGEKLKVLRFTNPKVFRDECCQFTTRFQDLSFERTTETGPITTKAGSTSDGTNTEAEEKPSTVPPTLASKAGCTTNMINFSEPVPLFEESVENSVENLHEKVFDGPMKVEPDLKKRKL